MIRSARYGTPLHVACTFKRIDIAEYLIAHCDALVNAKDEQHWTPLHAATLEGHEETVELLCRVQRKRGEATNDGELSAVDGPIDLRPKNSENQTPEDLCDEVAEQEDGIDHGKRIKKILQGEPTSSFRAFYPRISHQYL